MGVNRVVARIPMYTGIPEDIVTNTFHFQTLAAPTSTQINAMMEGVIEFYTGAAPTDTVGKFLAPYMSRAANACQVEVYDLLDPIPRQPIGDDTFTLPTVSGTGSMPGEVASCLSYRGLYVSGQVNARRRGRVFIGPLSSGALVAGTASAFPYPVSSFVATVLQAAEQGLAGIPGLEGCTWCVYSPTADSSVPVVEAWMDNAFDTQRRRGNAATTRTSVSI